MKKKIGLLVVVVAVVAGATALWYDRREVHIRTTSSSIAVGNLSAQIDGVAQQVQRFPQVFGNRRKLVQLLLQRTQFLGTYGDFDQALKVAMKGMELAPDQPETRALYATVLTSLHRFPEAHEAIRDAGRRGLPAPELARLEDNLDLAWGRNFRVIEARRKAASLAHPNYSTLTALASVKRRMGEFSQADRLYRRGLKAYRDVSPFAVAWVNFQRGVMWAEEAGDTNRGRENYRRALKALPEYVVANVHASEIDWEQGRAEQAKTQLRRVLGGDPEPAGLLGEILQSEGKQDEARSFIAQAKTQYEDLLARHRAAFSDHGSEFFTGPGNDPSRAWNLARENLELRPAPRSFLVALHAAEAAGLGGTICDLVNRAKTVNFPTPVLKAELDQRSGVCRTVGE